MLVYHSKIASIYLVFKKVPVYDLKVLISLILELLKQDYIHLFFRFLWAHIEKILIDSNFIYNNTLKIMCSWFLIYCMPCYFNIIVYVLYISVFLRYLNNSKLS